MPVRLYVQLHEIMLFCLLTKFDDGFFIRCKHDANVSTTGPAGLVHNIVACRQLDQPGMASIKYAKIVVNTELP